MQELIQYLLWSAFFTTIAFLLTRHFFSRNARLPPGPRPLPVLGNLLELGNNPHRSLARLARTHGPVMHLKLGSINTVIISSPSSAKEVLKTKEQATSGRQVPDVLKILDLSKLSVGFSAPNKLWRYLRTLMKTHLFNTKSLDATQQLRRRKVQELLAYVGGENGAPVQIGRAAFCTVLNLMSATFLSIDMVDFKSESAQELRDLISGIFEELGSPNISDFFPVLAPLDLQGRRRRSTAYVKKFLDFFDQIIENRLAEDSGTNQDILDSLLRLYLDDSSKLSRENIRCFLLDCFTAGSETSSTTIEWAMAELLRNPYLMTRARDELARVVGFDKEVDESDLSRLPFLHAVLKETFRLHPPAPFLVPHKVEACTEINGFMVPKNTQVLVNVWAMGRDERVWVNPDLFSPDRFLKEDEEIDFYGHNFELLPFGSGRRICPGLPLAVRMVELILASLIHSFEWRLPDGMTPENLDLKEKFGLTLVLASPLEALAIPKELI